MSGNVTLNVWSSCWSFSFLVSFHFWGYLSLNFKLLPLHLTSFRWGGLFYLRGSSVVGSTTSTW